MDPLPVAVTLPDPSPILSPRRWPTAEAVGLPSQSLCPALYFPLFPDLFGACQSLRESRHETGLEPSWYSTAYTDAWEACFGLETLHSLPWPVGVSRMEGESRQRPSTLLISFYPAPPVVPSPGMLHCPDRVGHAVSRNEDCCLECCRYLMEPQIK